MEKEKVNELTNGIYRVIWNDTSESIAAVGTTEKGKKWLAPTDWMSGSSLSPKAWNQVSKAFKLTVDCKWIKNGGKK